MGSNDEGTIKIDTQSSSVVNWMDGDATDCKFGGEIGKK